jgi:hypothetical protein
MNTLRWNRLRYTAYAPVYDTLVRPLSTGRRRAIELVAPRADQQVLVTISKQRVGDAVDTTATHRPV